MEEKNRREKKIRREGQRSHSPNFTQEWFYGPYQSLTSEQICLDDPEWLSEAISQEIIHGKFYFGSRLQELNEINPEFSITLEAKEVMAEREAKWEAQMAEEKKERERVEELMAARDLKYNELSEEAKAAHNEEIIKLIGPFLGLLNGKLESGKYEGYTHMEILKKHPEEVMEAFSKAIIDHYHFPHERQLGRLKHYCPDFKLSDEAAKIYKYQKDAHEEALVRQEDLDYLAYEEHLRDMADSLGEPTEGSSEGYNDSLDLDQQHPDFYQG